MKNGSECNPGGCHGLQSRCSDENWEVGSIPTRFRNNYMLMLVASFFLISFIFPQGMYVGKIDDPIYSFNIVFNSLNDTKPALNDPATLVDYNEKHYGLSLSYLFKGKNEFLLGYKENEDSKVINTSYSYYIKPDFYLNMFSGLSYEHIQKSSDFNEDKFSIRIGIYGNKKNETNANLGLQYFPFFIYEYVLHNIPSNSGISNQCRECYYDAITLGCSFLFNDIGFEPSYSWWDKDTSEFSLKIYLWEFGN